MKFKLGDEEWQEFSDAVDANPSGEIVVTRINWVEKVLTVEIVPRTYRR